MRVNYQRILMHILIDNTWPAIVMDDYTLRIELVRGQYFTEHGFEVTKAKMPFDFTMLNKIKAAYKNNWKKELTGNGGVEAVVLEIKG